MNLLIYNYEQYMMKEIDSEFMGIFLHQLNKLPLKVLMSLPFSDETFGVIAKNSWKSEDFKIKLRSTSIGLVSDFRNKGSSRQVNKFDVKQINKTDDKKIVNNNDGTPKKLKQIDAKTVEKLLSKIDLRTFSDYFFKEKELFAKLINIEITNQIEKKKKKKDIVDIRNEVVKIRNHDTENSKKLHIEWSGCDIMEQTPNTKEEIEQTNEMIKKLENLQVIVLPLGLKNK